MQASKRYTVLPPQWHLPVGQCIPIVSKQFARRVPAWLRLLRKRCSTCVECANKHIDQPIQQNPDPEMYRMIQSNIRGGICHASVRCARANNKLMGSLYDPMKPIIYIMEIDANNLYCWAMSQEMPDGYFEWFSKGECRKMELLLKYANGRIANIDLGAFNHRMTDEKKKSFIFEVKLKYPPELHKRGDNYPIGPEVMTIEPKITGEKQHNLRAQYFGATYPFSLKLICLFLPKKYYVVLEQLLRFYLNHGMRLV